MPPAPTPAPAAPAARPQDENQRALLAHLARLRALLERAPAPPAPPPLPATLQHLAATFHLTPFESDVVLLCAGVELDAGFARALAQSQGDGRRLPTFSLALSLLPGAHWSALLPDSPLRRWRLVDLPPNEPLTLAPLRIDERVLHHLVGLRHVDERLAPLLAPLEAPRDLTPGQVAAAERAAATWTRSADAPPVLQLSGADASAARGAAAHACALLGLDPWSMHADLVPAAPADQEAFLRAWEREAALAGRVLVVEAEDAAGPGAAAGGQGGDDGHGHDHGRAGALLNVLDRLRAPVLLLRRERLRTRHRPLVLVEVPRPTRDEQARLWRAALPEGSAADVDALTSQFQLDGTSIRAAAADAAGRPDAASSTALWEACRAQARPRLESLAERIPTAAGWDALVLPQSQADLVRAIGAQVRQRRRVYEEWGFGSGAQGVRGLGISALFAGESGTGKTLAAEVLAHELRLDLWRVDLSQVVSKYIGETEKNLRRIFDAAEDGAGILLFDEADALFGKRSEVKDSHDRYANVEVSYLLQRMESYRGLSILTTNLKESIDTAFLRRIRFVVHFPFPDAASRAQIWHRAFPREAPTRGLEPDKLARLNVAGGNIRTIALNAAFLAAHAGEPITMRHVLQAARAEYAKLEKHAPDHETEGWT